MADIKFSLDEEVFFRNTLAHLRVIHDVILKTQDVITDDISPDSDDILANRQLLSISSAYFKDLLSGVSMDVNEVVIKGVTHGMLAKVVEVTHTGATEFRDKKEAVEFMEIAKR